MTTDRRPPQTAPAARLPLALASLLPTLLLGLNACGSDTAASAKAATTASTFVAPPTWDETTCPDGATLHGAPPPAGDALYCAIGDVRHGPLLGFDPAGATRVAGAYDHGLEQGPWAWWHANGAPAAAMTYVQGQADGDERRWHDDGSVETLGQWTLGAHVGRWQRFWPANPGQKVTKGVSKGPMREDGSYKDGLRDGVWLDGYANGKQQASTTWAAGVRSGKAQRWRQDGSLQAEGSFADDLESGVWTRWWPNGVKMGEGPMVAGLDEGLWQAWDEQGRIVQKSTFVAGLAEGAVSTWLYGDGFAVRIDGTMVHGIGEGLFTSVREPDGLVLQTTTFFHGLAQGLQTTWHVNGHKRSEGMLNNGQRNGLWTYWFDNDQMDTQGHFDDGNAFGPWTSWHENGVKAWEATLSATNTSGYVGQLRRWWPNGNVREELRYDDPWGHKEGPWRTFYQDSQTERDATYAGDVLDGAYAEFWPDGSKRLEGTYLDGQRHGAWTAWDEAGVATTTTWSYGVLVQP